MIVPGRCWSASAAIAMGMVITPLCSSGSVGAAEIRLQAECRSDGALVTLGDVAEIFATDQRQADALAAVELFPAPCAARQRFVGVREIQDLLLLQGINLAEHRFSGSSRVAILGGERVRPEPERPLSSSAENMANRRVRQAVVQYVRQQANLPKDLPRIVEVQLDPSQARLVAQADRAISITGGGPPWTGRQHFEVTVQMPEGPVRFPLDVQVETPQAMVFTVRSLPRGAILHAADVILKREMPQGNGTKGFSSIEEVIGKETNQAIAKGRMLQPAMVRSPLLVRRREIVTVYARSSGIRVRTMGRAREDGGLGELIAVESLQDRKPYYARVSGVREVEVYARSIQAGSAGPTRPSHLAGR